MRKHVFGVCDMVRPNKKNKYVSGNGSENFRVGTHIFFIISLLEII